MKAAGDDLAAEVADNSIRPGILKVFASLREAKGPRGCRQLDPTGDTESSDWHPSRARSGFVADNSIRPGILKVKEITRFMDAVEVADNSIRPGILKAKLDGTADALLEVADNSIRPGILKDVHDARQKPA